MAKGDKTWTEKMKMVVKLKCSIETFYKRCVGYSRCILTIEYLKKSNLPCFPSTVLNVSGYGYMLYGLLHFENVITGLINA